MLYYLLSKLYKYGIRGKIWDLFKSYLTIRKQYVAVGDSISDIAYLFCGVQGFYFRTLVVSHLC